ncbi:MAG: signal recognition particle subunit SRP19/SEC65 family protein [Desulfurococcales archaeon]|nr:signal recognition particle subunit SRP19/SEC65 family protein [Desulfurococcales archaeon]
MPKKVVVWPEYLTSNLTRREGRKVPKELAVRSVRPELLLKACESLRIRCEVEEGKNYPRAGVRSYGFRLIAEVGEEVSKYSLIKKIAYELRQLSSQ